VTRAPLVVVSMVSVAAACGGSAAIAPDAETPYHYVAVVDLEPVGQLPRRDPAPRLFFDGVEEPELAITFPSYADALADGGHLIELRAPDGTTVVATASASPLAPCFGAESGPTKTVSEYIAYDSGDIRATSASEETTSGQFCVGDGSGDASCPPCADGERCTVRAASIDPLYTHLACAPIGPNAAGAACTYIADPGGAYDTCDATSLCVDGTCRRLCHPADPTACTTCANVVGVPPELQVCTDAG
jgi:hypothetical protein